MPSSRADPRDAAEAVVHAYIEAFNVRDAEGMADAFNFPHVRLAKGSFTYIDTREVFVERQAVVTRLLTQEGWDHTVTESLSVVHAGEDKVHLRLEYTRRHADGTPYTRFDTLWIPTLLNGHWGIQFRSSYLTSDASTLGSRG